MSAAVDAARRRSLMDTSTDSDDLGVVVPLHPQRTRREPASAPARGLELGPVSPELALVDPELALWARSLLPDPDALRPAVAAPAELPAAPLEIVPVRLRETERTPERAPRRRAVVLGGLALAGWILAALVLLLPTLKDEPATSAEGGPPKAAQASTGVPDARPPVAPAPAAPTRDVGARAPATQTFVWVPVPDAASYEFQLFRGDQRIYRTRVREPRLALPARWRQGGRAYQLTPGSYRWYVWPVSRRSSRPVAVAVVQARLVIEEPQK